MTNFNDTVDPVDAIDSVAAAPIYLDYAATTPVDPRVVQNMLECLSMDGVFGNPASQHVFGLKAKEKIEESRKHIADLIHTVPRNIVFTSGATEANNLAIKGTAKFYQSRGKHIVTCKTEHKAILDVCRQLEKEGFLVTYLDPEANGLLDINKLESVLRPDTLLVSIMQVNNETGVKQNIEAMGALTRKRGIFFHVDAAQSLGKIPIDVQQLPVDLMSFSAHKIYGPKGIGALYVGDRPRVRLSAEMQGGEQERNMRAGTLATHQIVGFGQACRIAGENLTSERDQMKVYRDRFWAGIQDLPGVRLNSDLDICVSNILNVRFSTNILSGLGGILQRLAVSNGAACNTLTIEPSHVLRAMGLSPEQADYSIRFSFGRFTTTKEITSAIDIVRKMVLQEK
ncbi:MAG TPA: aminotransferase class V-fold PLP-dependent enzyme [Gammaproteobacteria bacterium]|nr:aminotransferase class V-fold PLP-dependent enzyme [Gammaproteobacteria bacterium]